MSDDTFTAGRYVVAWTDNAGMRDPISLVEQVSYLRVGMEEIALKPALIVIAVHEPETEAAVERIRNVLAKGARIEMESIVTGEWVVIEREQAEHMITTLHIVGLVDIASCGADMNMLLSDGQVISYWAPTDASPEDWWLWQRA